MKSIETTETRFSELLDNLSQAARLLGVLAHPSRLWLVQRLLYSEACVTVLADELHISSPAVSQHLSKLREAGLVTCRRDRQMIYYSASSPHIELLLSTFNGLYLGGSPDTAFASPAMLSRAGKTAIRKSLRLHQMRR